MNKTKFEWLVVKLASVEDIDKSIEMFVNSDISSLVSVCKAVMSPFWLKKLDEKSVIQDFIPQDSIYVRRQDSFLYMIMSPDQI
jgi:CMP-N-acetylneuraminic acid synthetase